MPGTTHLAGPTVAATNLKFGKFTTMITLMIDLQILLHTFYTSLTNIMRHGSWCLSINNGLGSSIKLHRLPVGTLTRLPLFAASVTELGKAFTPTEHISSEICNSTKRCTLTSYDHSHENALLSRCIESRFANLAPCQSQ